MPPSRNSAPSPPNAPTNSVRRNLFSAHLSRRPVSNQSQSQPQPQPQLQSQSQSRSTSSTSATLPTAPQPRLQRIPSLPHSPLIPDLNNYYNSDLPNPFSPQPTPAPAPASAPLPPTGTTIATYFPHNSIIAIHPVTGRPILPSLPTLPAHLRLSTSSSDPEAPPHHSADDADDYTHSSAYWASTAGLDDQEREDKERIEKSLVDMMYRQRKRGQSRGRGRGKERDGGDDHLHHGDGLGPMESEELMGLIMASLRKKVGSLDEDAWMFEAGGGRGANLGVGEGVGEMTSNRYN